MSLALIYHLNFVILVVLFGTDSVSTFTGTRTKTANSLVVW